MLAQRLGILHAVVYSEYEFARVYSQ